MAILIEPGKTIGARLLWRNRGPLLYAPQMRLHLRNSDFGATWQEGPWVRSPQALPGGSVAVEVVQGVPDNWDDKLIDVRVEIQNGGQSFEAYREDYFLALRNRFRWTGNADEFSWAYPDNYSAVYGKRTPQHRGPAKRVWVGFGVFPVVLVGQFAFVASDPNNIQNYGPEVWNGAWVEWAENDTWQSMPSPQEFWMPWPAGYGEAAFAAYWVVQSENPGERRMMGLAPVTFEFGEEANKWDLANYIVKGAAEVSDIPFFEF